MQKIGLNNKKWHLLTLATLFGIGFLNCAVAQNNVPNIGDVEQQNKPPRQLPDAQQRPTTPQLIVPQGPELAPPAPGEATMLINRVVFQGDEFIEPAKLQTLVQPYIGRELSFSQMQQIAELVTTYYRSQGYMLAQAILPPQDATNGQLLIEIAVGRFGQIDFVNNSHVSTKALQRYYKRLMNKPVTRKGLERAMYLTADLPGAQMPNLTVAAGKEPGSSDFVVEVAPAKALNFYAGVDNYGATYTGKARYSFGLIFNSPLGQGDQFIINTVMAHKLGMQNGRVEYRLPIGGSGLRAGMALFETSYDLGRELFDFEIDGHSKGYEVSLNYPLLLTEKSRLNLYGRYIHKDLVDRVGVLAQENKKTMRTVSFGLRQQRWFELWQRPLALQAELNLTAGRLNIADAVAERINRQTINSVGSFKKLNLTLDANYAWAQKWSSNFSLSVQKALGKKILDSSEQMSITGSGGVRAYRDSVSGDDAYLLNLELQRRLPAWGRFVHSGGVFAGAAHSRYARQGFAAQEHSNVYDAGVVYTANFNSLINLKLQWTHRLGKKPPQIGRQSRNMLLAQLSLFY